MNLTRNEAKYFSKANKVINKLFQSLRVQDLNNQAKFNAAFTDCYACLLNYLAVVCRDPTWRRVGELSYTTLYNNLTMAEKSTPL